LCKAISGAVENWPTRDMRGQPQHGHTSQLLWLWIYEDVEKVLEPLPRGPLTFDGVDERKRVLQSIFHEVSPVPGRKGRDLFHPETHELYFEPSDGDVERWSKLPRHRIALEITSKILRRTGINCSPSYLHRLLPELRSHDSLNQKIFSTRQKSK